MTDALRELRVLEGPNLYFPRAAVKLTLGVSALSDADVAVATGLARRIGLPRARPGEPGTGFRQRFAARALDRLVRQVAGEAGTTRLAVRVRPTADPSVLVVAYPWRHRGRGRALGTAVADVLDGLAADRNADVDALVSAAAAVVRDAEPGPGPTTLRPHVPVVAVTGTNGKTTTARLIGAIGRAAGLHVGWSSTDGVYADGGLVESGDYSGPSGARRVLEQPDVQLGVLETARGGILLKGMGVTAVDVSVVTNVSADHLGLQGIDTLDQLAEVKVVVPRATKPGGWAVLNGDDPRVLAMRAVTRARPWVFTRDPNAPAVRLALGEHGRATAVIDGWVAVLRGGADPQPVVPLLDVPMTLSGLSRHNVENALAAASAALGVGLSIEAVRTGLATFAPGPADNPGRLNAYSLDGVTVVLDMAHNEASLEALLDIAHGLCPAGRRTLLALGTAGDRTDELIRALGAIGARRSDALVVVHKDHYLRGRSVAEMEELFRAGAAEVGVHDVAAYPGELSGLHALVAMAQPGDVVAVMCHQDRAGLDGWLRECGATIDTPTVLRDKVRAAAREPR